MTTTLASSAIDRRRASRPTPTRRRPAPPRRRPREPVVAEDAQRRARERRTRRRSTTSTTSAAAVAPLPVDVTIDGTRPSAPARPAPRRPGSRLVNAAAFTVALPPRWRTDVVDRDEGGFVHSSWHLDGSPNVRLILDYTPEAKGGAEAQAAPVRAAVSRRPGYREIEWRRGRVARRSWRWRFRLRGVEKFDTFAVVCDTGYALLSEAPIGDYEDHAADFDAIRSSFRPRC